MPLFMECGSSYFSSLLARPCWLVYPHNIVCFVLFEMFGDWNEHLLLAKACAVSFLLLQSSAAIYIICKECILVSSYAIFLQVYACVLRDACACVCCVCV